jgi:four helix bundle protein
MAFMFQKLEVYQKSVDFAEAISNLTDTFPKGYYYLVDQLNRASLSIAANLAEGNGRWHKGDRKQFFWIARGSSQECVPLLEIAKRKKFLKEDAHAKLLSELETINKMITGLIKGLEKE